MVERLALAIDLGTSGPKVALIGEDGSLVASAGRQVKTERVGPRGAEQDPEELWRAVIDSVTDVLARSGDRRRNVVGLVCISQYSSVVPVSADGVAVGNLILWMDGRGAPYGTALYGAREDAVPTWIDHHGVIPLPSGADSLSHILFVKNERSGQFERARYFLEAMDFLAFRFSGECSANAGTAFMMLLTDNRNPSSIGWDPELMGMAGVGTEKLPPLGPLRGRVGTVRRALAEQLGLPEDVGVYASMNDTQAAAIGTGAFLPERGGLNMGTTCQVLAHRSGKGSDFEAHLVSMPSPIPGKWLILAENGLAGGALRHFVEGVLFADGPLGRAARADPFEHLDAAVSGTEPGAGGVLFLPWLEGALYPDDDPAMRGGFLNVSLATTREQLVRAVMEGVAVNLCAMIPPVERFAETSFATVAFSGGGALSSAWAQILADVSGKPVQQLAHPRYVNNFAGALTIFAESGGRELSSITEFVRAQRTLEPRPALAERYGALAENQRRAFDAVRALMPSLRTA